MNFLEEVEKLPTDIRTFLLSDKPRLESEKACFMYGLKEKDIPTITQPTGLMFVGDEKIENLPNIIINNLKIPQDIAYGLSFELTRRLFHPFKDYFKDSQNLLNEWSQKKSTPIISEDEAWKKVLEIEPWLLKSDKSTEETGQKKLEIKPKTEKFALLDAIRVYPEINEQLITSQPIRLKNYPEAVRPSIKNWIADYTFQLGYEHHDSIARGNFIFKSENGKNLTPNDRARLSEILKSFDEKTPLEVDTLAKQIVFSPSQEKNISEKPVLSPSHPNENPSFTVDLREKTASVPTAEKTESLPRKETFSFSSAPKEVPSSFHRDMPNQMVLSRKPEEKNFPQPQPRKIDPAPKNNLSFSSPQKLPIERNDAPIQDQKTVSSEPQTAPQPMRIRPVSNNGNSLWKREVPPENVVNLKE